MQYQTSFADVEYDSHRVTTRKERFQEGRARACAA